MGLKDMGKLKQHFASFNMTMDKIFTQLKTMSDQIDKQSKVMNAMIDAIDTLDARIKKLEKKIEEITDTEE